MYMPGHGEQQVGRPVVGRVASLREVNDTYEFYAAAKLYPLASEKTAAAGGGASGGGAAAGRTWVTLVYREVPYSTVDLRQHPHRKGTERVGAARRR